MHFINLYEKSIMGLTIALPLAESLCSKNSFEEYNLDNGLHVILHHDPSAPVVITSVMYHVGSKDENQRKLVLPFFSNIYYLKD
jgi:CO dehydrogenase/acetyl-CoA synthase gamma subunit (corrinoid Fe-S protein)